MLPLEDVLGERLTVTVLRHLASVEGGVSGNGLARQLGAQQSAIRKALERLVARGLVTRTDVGRTAIYALDDRRDVVTRIVLPLFRAEAALGRRLRRAVQRLARALDPAPAAVVLYGSLARGARDPRDVDLLVVARRDGDEEAIRNALVDAAPSLEERFHVAVSPVVIGQSELRKRAEEPFIVEIQRDGLLLAGEAVGPLRGIRRMPEPSPARRSNARHSTPSPQAARRSAARRGGSG